MSRVAFFEISLYAFLVAMLFTALNVFGAERCAWLTCLGQSAQNASAHCMKLNEGEIGVEFMEFVKRETGTSGSTVVVECVDRAKEDYLIVPQLVGQKVQGK